VPNAEAIAAMKEARDGKLESFNSVEDLLADLVRTIERTDAFKKDLSASRPHPGITISLIS